MTLFSFRARVRSSVLGFAAVGCLLAIPAMADTPVVNITGPLASGGVIYAPSFPYLVPVTFTVSHDNLNAVKDLDVLVDGVSILSSVIVNPYLNAACTAEGIAKLDACAANANNIDASGTKNWSIQTAGTHLVRVQIKHGGATGADEESIDIVLEIPIEVEYTAPPAIANAYLNSGNTAVPKKQLTAGVRGCVIKMIAAEHSKNTNYYNWGYKPGPYNTPAVHAAVDLILPLCVAQN
jgi:hypothetical protein